MLKKKDFNEKIRQIGFLLILIFLACLIIGELRYFISAILGGFTIFLILRKPQKYLLSKAWGNTITTTVLLFIAFIFLLLTVVGLTSILYGKLKSFQLQAIVDELCHIRDFIEAKWGYNIFSGNVFQQFVTSLGNILPGFLSVTGNVVANAIMMMFVLFFMLQQQTLFKRGMEHFIPLSKESIHLLKNAIHNMVLSNAVGIPLIMFGQGLTAGLAYWILNAGDPVIWGIITGFFGLVPIVGTGGVWVPLGIELLISGQIWQGIVLIVYGVCIISNVDTVVRIVFLKKHANIHPLVTLFGVILGMNLLGFWGIIFGPLLISGFFLLLRIYKTEFR